MIARGIGALAGRDSAVGHALPVDWDDSRARGLLNAMPEIASVTGRVGDLEWVNDRWLAYTGLTASEAHGNAWQEVVHPDDRAAVLELSHAAREGDADRGLEFRFRRNDGAYRWHLGRVVPIRAADGRIEAWFRTSTDIHDRKHIEDDLRASEKRFRTVFERSPAPIAITRFDTGQYVDVNPSFLEISGYSREEVIGRTAVELNIWSPEDRASVIALLTGGVDVRALELPLQPKEGSHRYVRLSLEMIEVDGARCILAVGTDVTEQRRRDAALQQSEASARVQSEELSALLDVTPAAVLITHDRECTVIQGNRVATEHLAGVRAASGSPADLEANPRRSYRVWSGGVELARSELPLQTAAREGIEVRNAELEFRFEGGEIVHMYGNAVPLLDAEGKPRGAIAAFVDVGPFKQALAALRSADRRKDEFLAMLSHELRNPLAPILTAVQLMKMRGGNQHEHERAIIERQALHLVRLIEDLLDVARVAQGKIELRKKTVELATVITKGVETASPLFEQRQHHLLVDVAPKGLPVDADEARLGQVVANLLTNAARYTPNGGTISVVAGREADAIVVRVRDNGVGIAPDLLPRLFDLFVQSDRRPEGAEGGLGLGLALVRSLVDLHGGTVEARSDGPGCGSEFTVRLPVATAQAQERTSSTSVSTRKPAERRHRILVVDDNVDAAELLSYVLLDEGYDVKVANDAADALSVAGDFQPEVAILDIDMPVMDGYTLGAELQRRLGKAAPKLVALTGYGQEGDRRRSREAGFAMHIVKPVDASRMLEVIEGLAL
jgi:PAS domain S-box-containing protein